MRVMITCDGIRIADGRTAGWKISNAVPSYIRNEKGRKLMKKFTELKNLRICMKKKGALV